MTTKPAATVEDLEEYWATLNGPLRPVYRQAGAIISRKMRERDASLCDLSDLEVGALLFASMIEAAADIYPGLDTVELEEVMGRTLAEAAMAMAANADGSESVN